MGIGKKAMTLMLAAVLAGGLTACGGESARMQGAAETEAAATEAAVTEAVAAETEAAAAETAVTEPAATEAADNEAEAATPKEAASGAAAPGLCEYEVIGETDLPGQFFLSFVYSRNLILLDGKGNLVWSKHEDPVADGTPTGFWDFKKHVIDGKTYYSYHDQTGEYDNWGMEGFAPGERVILDENFNEVKRITFEESDTVEKGHPLDGHDFYMIDLDHYFLSGYIKDTVYNNPDYPDGSSVVYSYLQEVENGKAVWDFKTCDYPELYAMTVTDGKKDADDFGNVTTDVPDYVHFNAMRLDEDGDLIVSYRHLSSILCLDRTKEKDQIKWFLSGRHDEFGLSEQEKTNCQHYVTLDGNYIMAFDNNNRNEATRIVCYRVDEDARRLEAFRAFAVGRKFSQACGSVQRVKDELFVIGWGCATKDNDCMSVVDFSTGDTLMKVKLANPQDFTYRCVYYE